MLIDQPGITQPFPISGIEKERIIWSHRLIVSCETEKRVGLFCDARNDEKYRVERIPKQLKEHIQNTRMRKDKASALCSIWMYLQRKAGWECEVEIYSTTLKSINSRYREHIDTLRDLGLLKVVKQYSVGSFPKTYCVNHCFVPVEHSFSLILPTEKKEKDRFSENLGEKQLFLKEALENNAKHLHVASYVPQCLVKHFQNQLDRITNEPHRSFSDAAGGRHFTMFTQCPKIFRHGFQADGENLISFDVIACHASILAELSRDKVMEALYREADIYQRIAEEKRGGREVTREDVKRRFTCSLNDPKQYPNRQSDWLFVTMKELFPVAHAFCEENHPVGSILLRKEVDWWLMDLIYNWLRGNWGISVHDEIVIKAGDESRMWEHVKSYADKYPFRFSSEEMNEHTLEEQWKRHLEKCD